MIKYVGFKLSLRQLIAAFLNNASSTDFQGILAVKIPSMAFLNLGAIGFSLSLDESQKFIISLVLEGNVIHGKILGVS